MVAVAGPDTRHRWRSGIALAAVILLLTATAMVATRAWPFADAGDGVTVTQGKQLYMTQCASCHGRYLQGQPLWQLADAYAGRRAPAQDQTGHTWQHSDAALFTMIKEGNFAGVAATRSSAMPAFRAVLVDREILAVIAFIKARWPIGLRVLQAMRNPGQAGMPAGAERADWTFPPDCQAAGLRARATPAGAS